MSELNATETPTAISTLTPMATATAVATAKPEDGETILSERALAAWEIVSVVCSIIVAEWAVLALADASKLFLVVPVGCACALMLYSHRARHETARCLGWRFDNFGRALLLLLPPMSVGAVLLALVAWLWFGNDLVVGKARAGWALLGLPIGGFVWGLLQQYVLQAFINRRAQMVWGAGWRSVFCVAALFGLLHLPNPWLATATFAGGLVWAWVYQHTPNLCALAVSHACMTWVLVSTLPPSALRGLRVGYKFFG